MFLGKRKKDSGINWDDISAIIAGLGNPGQKYTGTRHNLGYRVLDEFLSYMEVRKNFSALKNARAQVIKVGNKNVILVKPSTYMNLSGNAVSHVLGKTELGIEDVLVIHDEMDIPVGYAKMRIGGGSAGHKGVRHIIEVCGSGFSRLKVGIGWPHEQVVEGGTDFVLDQMDKQEENTLTEIMPGITEGIKRWVDYGPEKAMTWLNTNLRLKQDKGPDPETKRGEEEETGEVSESSDE